MKILAAVLAILMTVAFGSNLMASMPGKTLEYVSKVIFDGSTHGEKQGMKCAECHPKLFQMKKGSFKMPFPHKAGELCGVCHDGKKIFGQVEPDTCVKCHKKAEPATTAPSAK